MSFAKPRVPVGIGSMAMGPPDPPLLFPADDFLLTPGALTYSNSRQNDGAGDTVAACSGCGSRETGVHEGRHQCAYCRADRNSTGKTKRHFSHGEFTGRLNTFLGMTALRSEWMVKLEDDK